MHTFDFKLWNLDSQFFTLFSKSAGFLRTIVSSIRDLRRENRNLTFTILNDISQLFKLFFVESKVFKMRLLQCFCFIIRIRTNLISDIFSFLHLIYFTLLEFILKSWYFCCLFLRLHITGRFQRNDVTHLCFILLSPNVTLSLLLICLALQNFILSW